MPKSITFDRLIVSRRDNKINKLLLIEDHESLSDTMRTAREIANGFGIGATIKIYEGCNPLETFSNLTAF